MQSTLRGLPDLEHGGAAGRARALGCGLAVLHRDSLGVLHFLLGPAFNAIAFHVVVTILSAQWYG